MATGFLLALASSVGSGFPAEPIQAQASWEPNWAVRLAAWQSRRRSDLDGFAWQQMLGFGGDLTGKFESASPKPPLPLGDYYRSWYAVSIEDPGDDDAFEVRVLSRRKEQVAKFGRR